MRIIIQEENSAAYNMALDEAISEAVLQRTSPPTVRLYHWDVPSVTIGYFQKLSDINIGYCTGKRYPVIRRITGGRAILHDAELTYSVSSLANSFPFRNKLFENYTLTSKALVRGLNMLGIHAHMSLTRKRTEGARTPACFKAVSYGEVTVEGRKVIGSAQKRFRNGFLQQGSIMINFRAEELCHVLNGSNKEDFMGIGSLCDHQNGISLNDLQLCLKESFEKELNIKMISDEPTRFELGLAKELEQKKYSTREWNYLR